MDAFGVAADAFVVNRVSEMLKETFCEWRNVRAESVVGATQGKLRSDLTKASNFLFFGGSRVPALRKLQDLSVESPSWARPVPKKNLVIKLRRIRGQSSRGFGRFDSLGNHLAFHVRARVPHLGLCICNRPCHP